MKSLLPTSLLRVTLFTLGILLAQTASADWPHWRGPAYNGTSAAKNLPEILDVTTNLAWSAPLPGPANSTPILSGKTLYLSAFDKETKKISAVAIDSATGKTLWTTPVAEGNAARRNNNPATPSPVSDGKTLYILCGTGDLAALDAAGKILWRRALQDDVGRISLGFVYASSPLLIDGKLCIQILQNAGESHLLAVDPSTGKDLWKIPRISDARGETKDTYTTPVPLSSGDSSQVLVLGGNLLTSHDPATGKEIWRFGGFNPGQKTNWRIIPTPVVVSDLIVISTGRGSSTIAVKSGGKGDVTETHKEWETKGVGSDSPSPCATETTLYMLDSARGRLTSLEIKTGKKIATLELNGTAPFSASPTLADGKIYCLSESGEVVVVDAAQFKVLSRVTLEDSNSPKSTIITTAESVIIRTATKLWCFAKK